LLVAVLVAVVAEAEAVLAAIDLLLLANHRVAVLQQNRY
jgi:hypothetical protein